MATRIWTATLVKDDDVVIREGTFSYVADTARCDFEALYPGWRVATLIPGKHASGAYVFGKEVPVHNKPKQRHVDPWSMGEFYCHGRVPNCS